MNRRGFLSLLGGVVAGIALEKAIPLGRVWSFPKKIVTGWRFNSLTDVEPEMIWRGVGELPNTVQIETNQLVALQLEELMPRIPTLYQNDEALHQAFERYPFPGRFLRVRASGVVRKPLRITALISS